MAFGQGDLRSSVNPVPVPASVGGTISEALDAINAAHSRLDTLEDRILGGQPRAGEKDQPPSGLVDAAMRVRSAIIALNERLDRLGATL